MPAARVVVVLLIAVACLQVPLPDGRADDFDLPSLQSELLHAIDRVRPAVALISGRGSAFSGVIVSPQGHVLSVGHAVSPGAHYRLALPDGRRLRGIGKGTNPRADAALILITDPPGRPPVRFHGRFRGGGDRSTLLRAELPWRPESRHRTDRPLRSGCPQPAVSRHAAIVGLDGARRFRRPPV